MAELGVMHKTRLPREVVESLSLEVSSEHGPGQLGDPASAGELRPGDLQRSLPSSTILRYREVLSRKRAIHSRGMSLVLFDLYVVIPCNESTWSTVSCQSCKRSG